MYPRKSYWHVLRIIVLVIGIGLIGAVRGMADEDENQNSLVAQLSEIEAIPHKINKIDQSIKVITLVKSDQVAHSKWMFITTEIEL